MKGFLSGLVLVACVPVAAQYPTKPARMSVLGEPEA
jgi:hypothetical protein